MANGYEIQYNDDGSWTWREVEIMEAISDDAYVRSLEKQCEDWEKMYADLKAENEQLKQQLQIATGGASQMTEKAQTAQIRHV